MRAMLGLYDIGKRDEGQSANVRGIERPVVGGIVRRRESLPVRKRSELGSPFTSCLVVRSCAGDRDGSGLVRGVRYNLDRVRVEFLVCDGL